MTAPTWNGTADGEPVTPTDLSAHTAIRLDTEP